MAIIFLGPPGCGKGTQSKELQALGYTPISTGDLVRAEIAKGTPLGNDIKDKVNAGFLISDEMISELLEAHLSTLEEKDKILLDGYPRTLAQAELLESLLQKHGVSIEKIFDFQAPDDVLIVRLTGRFTCASCGAVYHKVFRPTKEDGKCDACGGESFTVRKDDTPDVVGNRLRLYYDETAPVTQFYQPQQGYVVVDATLSPEDVAIFIREQLGESDRNG